MDIHTPVIFTDGTAVFEQLAGEYIRHDKGFFILAPSGSGKSFFVNRQQQKHWIDGDVLWPLANADLTDTGWGGATFEEIMEINSKSDVITQQAKKLGFWIVGSSNNFLKPDAVVLPEWSLHKRYIAGRETSNYDGGATSNDLDGVKAHRAWIRKWKKHDVPCFGSVKEAATYLTNSHSRNK